jgi:HEPN domain-containing protein
MLPEPGRIAETKSWLEKAAKDLRGASIDRNAEPPFLEDVLFHSQQLAEKSLKAFLCWHDRPFRKIHNLVELGEACAKLDNTLEPLLRKAAVLTEYAWKFRYPGDVEEIDIQEADEAFHLAGKVFAEIKKRLPKETHPEDLNQKSGPTAHEPRAVYRVHKPKARPRKKK